MKNAKRQICCLIRTHDFLRKLRINSLKAMMASHGMAVVLRTRKKIERLRRRAGRIVLQNSQELISDAIIGRLGWKPLSERRKEHIEELVKTVLRGLFPIYSRAFLTLDAVISVHIILDSARTFF